MWKHKTFSGVNSRDYSGVEKARDEVAEFLNEQNLSKQDFFLTEKTNYSDEAFYIHITVWYKAGMSDIAEAQRA